MCGIHAAISADGFLSASPTLERRLRSRGPDHYGTVQVRLDLGEKPLYVSFTSTVLSLRGDGVAKQPLVDDSTGSVLCWNGEAWKLHQQRVQANDGEAILAELCAASRRSTGKDGTPVLDVFRAIEGPFSFVFFDRLSNQVYYGRDRLGRRSLLVQPGESFSLSSIAESSTGCWAEVEADGCYVVSLDGSSPAEYAPTRHGWTDNASLLSSIGVFNMTTPTETIKLTRGAPSVTKLRQHLAESLGHRVLQVPVPPGATPSDARLAVLFSGGLDCTVLARLASEKLPLDQAIDLINVAFENPRIASQNKGMPQQNLYELCPDRITGRKSFAELMSVCPERRWQLICVDVPYSLVSAHRREIVHLIYPHNTEMDLSIAYALYFAARGVGVCQERPYSTRARVLLSGLGADELFGGYIRHATAYSRQGYPGLLNELRLDVGRLGKRNLGRDDRVMAHWEREVRFPYLDEGLAKWAVEVPVWEKCDFENADADGVEPGKRVLRILAEELGLLSVAREKKRAIQFGARTAKMESGKVKGTALIS